MGTGRACSDRTLGGSRAAISGSLVHHLWFSGGTQSLGAVAGSKVHTQPQEKTQAAAPPFLPALSHAASVSEYLF